MLAALIVDQLKLVYLSLFKVYISRLFKLSYIRQKKVKGKE